MRTSLRYISGAFLLTVSLVCAGCSTSGGPGGVPTPISTESETAHALAVLNESATTDWVAVDTKMLASAGDLVVKGTVESWLGGDTVWSEGGMFFWSDVVAKIKVDEVLSHRENVPLPDSGYVYVRSTGGARDPQSFAEALPRGLTVVAYIFEPETRPMAPKEDNEIAAKGPQLVHVSGDPELAQKKLWMFSSPQGFAVQDGNQVRWPFIGSAVEGKVDDAGPGGPLDGLSDEQRKGAQANRERLIREGVDPDHMYDPENFTENVP